MTDSRDRLTVNFRNGTQITFYPHDLEDGQYLHRQIAARMTPGFFPRPRLLYVDAGGVQRYVLNCRDVVSVSLQPAADEDSE